MACCFPAKDIQTSGEPRWHAVSLPPTSCLEANETPAKVVSRQKEAVYGAWAVSLKLYARAQHPGFFSAETDADGNLRSGFLIATRSLTM